MFKPNQFYTHSYLQQKPFYLYEPSMGIDNQTFFYPDPFRSVISNPSQISLGKEQDFIRQLAPLQHGPERLAERPPHTQHVDWSSMFPNEVILHGPTNRRLVSLTFDDGPDNVWTPQVLDVLNRYNIKGTFMCVGQRIQQNPQVLTRIIREGHVVGNHSWSHPNFTKIPLNEVRGQIEGTANEVNRLTGMRPVLFRPPYGALNLDVIREIMSLRDKIIFWNVDSLDWDGLTGPQVAANILAHAGPGSIILQHCAGGRGESLLDTIQALPYVIQTLRQEGYNFVTVPQLLNIRPYH
ncbi:polysaccharide deacetylase family protein [Neobacillus massiliamazoniensis]|uniref:Polysaccharide deacetylase n=1 Tax=Neobacillus massiliamazoniensis TaxID=1499688 RepID=A0A0U1NWL6_9BACI|nr:polysaccharide deacetylase family protein [Neobacillus massiliamazoniensis]CRK82258.1 polysaccharide deacetylase [Neobacillus massiliamazoniensis]